MSTITGINIGNMAGCIADVRTALRIGQGTAPTFDNYQTDFSGLIADLTAAARQLPAAYQETCSNFINFLTYQVGENGFYQAFSGPPQDQQSAMIQGIVPELSLAIFQNGQNEFNYEATVAFRELVSDLYDGFLGKEQIEGITPPRIEVHAPLVKWGNPSAGPYTLPIDDTSEVGATTAVVSLPPGFAQSGAVAWVALGHETGGHDICHAYPGLLQELQSKVKNAVFTQFHSLPLANYWARCIDESMADVCGTLNMGPTAGVGLIAFFRGMMQDGRLRVVGGMNDPHPIDVLRGFMAAQLVAGLQFSQAAFWAQLIHNETLKDLSGRAFALADEQTGRQIPFPVNTAAAIESAATVADVLANAKLDLLNGHSFKEIQNWTDTDQQTADTLGTALRTGAPLPSRFEGAGFYATHVVAGAVQESFKSGANVRALFQGMKHYLIAMNRENPEWAATRAGSLPLALRAQPRRAAVTWQQPSFGTQASRVPVAREPLFYWSQTPACFSL